MFSCKKKENPRKLFNGKTITIPKGYDKQYPKMVKLSMTNSNKKKTVRIIPLINLDSCHAIMNDLWNRENTD